MSVLQGELEMKVLVLESGLMDEDGSQDLAKQESVE
jgi:hypothetical protein